MKFGHLKLSGIIIKTGFNTLPMTRLTFLFLLLALPFSWANAQGYETIITHIGDNNLLNITQSGTGHKVDVLQNSSNSSGLQNNPMGFGILNVPLSNVAVIEEHGDDHSVTVHQNGASTAKVFVGTESVPNAENTTTLHQMGDGNFAIQKILGADANNNELEVGQYGNDNFSWQFIDNGSHNKGEGTQAGSSNLIKQLIEGSYNDLEILQVGDNNKAYQWIRGSESELNEVLFEQFGDYNYASLVITGSENSFKSNQSGNSNRISGDKWFKGKAAGQTGSENNIHVLQMGDDNAMTLNQIGSENSITGMSSFQGTTQMGNENFLELNQVGEGNLTNGIQIDQGNTANITQTGNFHHSHSLQVGANNSALIIQSNN